MKNYSKVFTRNKEYHFQYPEDMKVIMDYLNSIGEVHVDPDVIEDLYGDFSDQKYAAGWMQIDNTLLEEFADWLEDVER